jgi:hypothetical protein
MIENTDLSNFNGSVERFISTIMQYDMNTNNHRPPNTNPPPYRPPMNNNPSYRPSRNNYPHPYRPPMNNNDSSQTRSPPINIDTLINDMMQNDLINPSSYRLPVIEPQTNNRPPYRPPMNETYHMIFITDDSTNIRNINENNIDNNSQIIDEDMFRDILNIIEGKRVELSECESDSECVICFKTDVDSTNGGKTKCGHVYHSECINKWIKCREFKDHDKCPYCRKDLFA